MKFAWDIDEEKWGAFAKAINEENFLAAYDEGDYIGCCRVGDLCFDIRAWNGGDWTGWGFELFCGGVDTGYGYSAREAMATGKYENKWEVPDELQYPYDEVDYGEFDMWYSEPIPPFDEFKSKAERVFEEFIESHRDNYLSNADLVAKANEPLHVW